MRLGINLLCASGHVGAAEYGLFDLARECGFDHVELPTLTGTPDDYARAAAPLDALGLSRGCTGITLPDADPTSADPDIRARGRAHLTWILDCAEAAGARWVGGPFHAPIGHFTGAGPTEDELARAAEAHRAMAEDAQRRGIVLALEILNRFETHFLNTAAQARAYAERVDHPAFGIMYDTFHAHIEEKNQPRAITNMGRAMTVLHVSENDRGVPGTGQVDFAAILAAARATGFDGPVVVEAFGSGLPELAAATRVWRPLFPDLPTLFRDGARAIRAAMDAA
jgi:D-psicose/D-tagatose/L-ribulose 3-epimerase